MKITPKFNFVEGDFDTVDTHMLCVPHRKYGQVDLCIKSDKDSGWNIPISRIKLHSKDLAVDADEVFDDAVRLCEEIARRWNGCETKK
jgi:hypothetical protein